MRNEEILDSWKAISEYLDRDTRTCARWEKELDLPVYRIDKDSSRSKVFAYKSEIDEWLKERANHREIRKKPFLEKRWLIIGLISAAALFLVFSAAIFIANGKFSFDYSENLSIAILPFENSNFSEYEQYIPEGISKEIFNNLSRINNIKIIPSTSLQRKNESNVNLKDLIERFDVNHVLETKFEKNENKLKIRVQLKRIDDDNIIWTVESEDRLENIFSLQEDICLKIHKKLNSNSKMAALPINNGKTQDYAAYDNYLKGNHILSKSDSENTDPWSLYNEGKYYQGQWTQESNEFAINLFSRAIEIDANFAPAYTGLARCYVNYINFNWDASEQRLTKAEELLKKAEEINTEYCEYYATRIQVYLLKYLWLGEDTKEKAFELAQVAIKKFPCHALSYALLGYCHYLRFGENGDESDFNKAIEFNKESYFLRPYHINNIRLAELFALNRDYDEALTVCEGIQGGESSLMAEYLKGEIFYYMGDLDKSEAIFQQFDNSLDFRIGSLFYLGMIAAQRGDTEEVERLIQKLKVMAPDEFKFYGQELKFASIYMGVGNKELGYKCLEDFFNKEVMDNTRYINNKYVDLDKNFDNFREEERFKSIINNKGGMK
ncbi:MAG: hypothetical protein E3J56_07190 [Candidatus Aminicenantes bacterium]|nr:MAG: hypothetical protein E3J56_07190 [Candidatus Aminicenantes bacterium]